MVVPAFAGGTADDKAILGCIASFFLIKRSTKTSPTARSMGGSSVAWSERHPQTERHPQPHELQYNPEWAAHPDSAHPWEFPDARRGHWPLRWREEFDGTRIGANPAKWTHEVKTYRNLELQDYRVERARSDNGVLTITSDFDPESMPENCSQPSKHLAAWCNGRHLDGSITSSSIISKANFTYGQFDARIRINVQDASWPAWWFTGVHRDGWPADGGASATQPTWPNDPDSVCSSNGGAQRPTCLSSTRAR